MSAAHNARFPRLVFRWAILTLCIMKSPGTFAFKIYVAVSLLLGLTLQIKSTGAIPGDEFEAAGFLYNSVSALRVLAIITAVLAAGGLLVQCRRTGVRLGWVLTLGLIPLGFVMPFPCFAAGLFFIELEGFRRQRHELIEGGGAPRLLAQGEALAKLSWRRLLGWWPPIALLAATGALVVTGAESVVYTASFSPELFDEASLSSYRMRLLDLSAAFGAGMALLYLVPMFVAWPLLLWLRNCRQLVMGHQVVALCVALLATLFTRYGLRAVVGDEIDAVGLTWHTELYLSLLFLLWYHSVRRNLLLTEATGGAAIWCVAVMGLLGLPTEQMPEFLRKSPRLSYLSWAVLAGVLLFCLVYTSYPKLEDFRSKLIALGVITAIHVIVLLQIALVLSVRRGRTIRVHGATLLAACVLILGGTGASLRPISATDAQIIHEYARFGYIIKRGSIRNALSQENRTGYGPVDAHFEHQGEGDGVFPVEEAYQRAPGEPPIVIILWDAARHDHMSCYGYPRVPATTPNMDRMAAESVMFENAYSAATATTCGVRHLFTGNYSTRYMLAEDHDPFFVHALRKHGYRDFLITAFGTDYNGVSIDAFQRNADPASMDGSNFRNLTRHPQGLDRERPDSVKAEKMIEAWRAAYEERGEGCLEGTFSFLHLTGTHFPWKNNNPVHDYGADPVSLYDGETAKCDALTGQALDTLREIGAYDDAIIILLADHGTGLREHGRWAGFLTYEEQIRIPLIIKMPGVKHRRVQEVVGTIDIAPTLIGLFEPGQPNPYDGVSLMPLMVGDQTRLGRKDIVSFCSFEDAYSLIHDRRWKLHYHRSEDYMLLFDLKNDPLERRNLVDENPGMTTNLVNRMAAFLWRGRTGYGNPYHYRDWTPPGK